MKYIILASLLSSAALAAPLAQQGQATSNGNAGASRAGAGTAGAQAGAGQTATGQTQQGATQQGAQGTTGTTGTQGTGATGQQNAPQQGAGAANGQTPTAGDLATAVSNWMADTSMVSNFLNTGAGISNNVAFKQAATVAFNAEVNELNQKAVIDKANGNQPNVQAANSTLATGGAFQDVVDKLQEMSVKGRAAVANIDLINQNRCVNVLPNIDAYMASTGSASRAVRPQACDQTGVVGGVQGTGPTQPGQAPGTPQAAFQAAQALASGQGNGQVQNGAGAGTTGTAGTAQGQAGTAQGQTPAQGQAGTTQGQTPAQGQAGTAGAQTPTQGQAGTAAQGQTGQQAGTAGTAAAQGQQAGAAGAQGQAGATKGQAGAAKGQQAGAAGAAGATQ